jgi:hypothetical protein
MTTPTAPTTHPGIARADQSGRITGTRIGAAFGLASIALVATGFAIASPTEATMTSSPDEVVAFYTEAGLATTLTGGLIEVLGLVLFLPFAAMLTGRVAGGGPAGSLLAPTARMAATVYVALCLAPGMSGGAAALWLAHHGVTDAGVLTALNDVRSLSYFIALLPYAVFLLGVGIAGLLSHRLPRWAAWSGAVVGGSLLVSIPFAAYGLTDLVGFVGLLWVISVSVALLRRPDGDEPAASIA